MQCRFCLKEIEDGAVKCHHCGEYLQFHCRAFLHWIQQWSSVLAILGLWVAFRSLSISQKEFGLKYYTDVAIRPVTLDANFSAKGEDPTQVWTTIVLEAHNNGTVPAEKTQLSYRIGGPCRGHFTNEAIKSYTGLKSPPFDILRGHSTYFVITFTDARTCVQDYLAGKNYLEVEVKATFEGLASGTKRTLNYFSKSRSMGKQFFSL